LEELLKINISENYIGFQVRAGPRQGLKLRALL
jgi:hypothetical protein